jgi:type II secretory ATPase GspE/PulE/Tfp pilus assembly ATPase PilB-like protein
MNPMLAVVDHPSFHGFPWLALLTSIAFIGTALVCIGGSRWISTEAASLGVKNGEWWAATAFGLSAMLAIGVVLAGPLAVAVAAAVVSMMLYVFAKRRDLLVSAEERVLTRAGLAAAVAGALKPRTPDAEVAPAAPKERKPMFREQAASLLALLEKLKRPTTGRPKPRAGAADGATEQEPDFMFLKKDGSPALRSDQDDDAMSQNVVQSRRLMVAAMKAGATDLHFEPHERDYFARLRVDGVLRDGEKISQGMGRGVISAIKVIADMDIAERRRPQDGTFSAQFGSVRYDVRVASTPTSYGEKLVLRLLQSSGGVMNSGLDSIGLRKSVLKDLREIIHKPYGMFIVAGPTGSGKTTTVYSALSEIDARAHNITTIEDPVEYRLENITQIAVNSKAGVSFASILRSVLRQDPDVLLVGEIRDKETAEIACQAALTGHFVFSTLHANDTVATVTRLLDLGLEPTLLQSSLTAVLGQRLARKLCPHCKEACSPPDGLAKKFIVKGGAVGHIYREKGCEQCGGSGYRGRMGIHELLIMDDSIRSLITEHPSVTDLAAAAKKRGTVSLRNDGYMKVLKGETSLNEVMRVTT